MRDTGERIFKTDVALLAGYHSLRELQSYQRNELKADSAPHKNIDRALSLDSSAALAQLQRRRTAAKKRTQVQ
jgi:hypothetical protein